MITDKHLWSIIKKKRIPVNDIFMKDNPPNNIKPNGYIINLQDTTNAEGIQNNGTHWVAIFAPRLPREDIIYFDSFGFAIPQSLINWIRMKGGIYKNSRIVSNDKQIQDIDTGYCGIYSLFFIDFMNKVGSYAPLRTHRHQAELEHMNSIKALEKFIRLWSDDTQDNLNLLRQFVDYVIASE